MPVYSPPPVDPVSVSLTLGDRIVDLTSRALVVSVVPSPRWARESEVISGVRAAADSGADLVEVPADPSLLGPAAQAGSVPVAARVTTASSARSALSAGASLLLVPVESLEVVRAGDGPHDTSGEMSRGGTSQDMSGSLAVMVRDIAGVQALRAPGPSGATAGESPVAFDTLHLTEVDLVAEATLALSCGARVVRTHDVRKIRRVVEVIASLLEARQ